MSCYTTPYRICVCTSLHIHVTYLHTTYLHILNLVLPNIHLVYSKQDDCECLVQRRPCEYVPFFTVLQRLHARVLTGDEADGSTDASITTFDLHWDRARWPAAQITSQKHAAFVTDVCTSPT